MQRRYAYHYSDGIKKITPARFDVTMLPRFHGPAKHAGLRAWTARCRLPLTHVALTVLTVFTTRHWHSGAEGSSQFPPAWVENQLPPKSFEALYFQWSHLVQTPPTQ